MSDGNLQTWIAPDTMVEETGLSRSTVMGLLASLTAAGVLTRAEEGHRAKTTRIAWEALATYQPAATKRGGARVQSDNRTVESDNRTPEMDCTKTEQGSEHRTEGSDNRTAQSDNRTPKSPIIGPDPIMIRPMIRPVDPGDVPTPSTADLQQSEPEPDWDAIAAATLKARDAEIDGYFTSPIDLPPPPPKPSPEPAPRKRAPDFGALFGGSATPKPQQPQAEPEEAGLPVDLDLLQMLTTRPDGAQATALGVATRWVRLLTSQGIDSPGDLQRYTVREVQMLPGMSAPSAGHVQAALEAWGGEMAKGGRELVDDLRRRVLRNDSSLTAAEKRQMDAANLRTSDIKKMSDYDVNTYAQRLDAARSRM